MSRHLQSKSLNNRIHSLDLLRGFAVLGILIMNITNFSHVNVAYMNPTIGAGLEGYNQYFHAFNYIFADTRFMSIFSILFRRRVKESKSTFEFVHSQSIIRH